MLHQAYYLFYSCLPERRESPKAAQAATAAQALRAHRQAQQRAPHFRGEGSKPDRGFLQACQIKWK